MALTDGGTQFELQFRPSRLGNWEVPKKSRPRAAARAGSTQFIADDRGHLLDTVVRSRESAWTSFRRLDSWNKNRLTRTNYPPARGCNGGSSQSEDKRPRCRSSSLQRHQEDAENSSGSNEEEQVTCISPDGHSDVRNLTDSGRELSSKKVAGGAMLRSKSHGHIENTQTPRHWLQHSTKTTNNTSSQTDTSKCQPCHEKSTSTDEPHVGVPYARTEMAFASEMKQKNSSHWPIADFAQASMNVSIDPQMRLKPIIRRTLIHPGPTDCTKNMVAFSRVERKDIAAEKTELTQLPKTARFVKTHKEIDYAIYWSIRSKPERSGRADSPDSGVNTPREINDKQRTNSRHTPEKIQTRKKGSPRTSDSQIDVHLESGYCTPELTNYNYPNNEELTRKSEPDCDMDKLILQTPSITSTCREENPDRFDKEAVKTKEQVKSSSIIKNSDLKITDNCLENSTSTKRTYPKQEKQMKSTHRQPLDSRICGIETVQLSKIKSKDDSEDIRIRRKPSRNEEPKKKQPLKSHHMSQNIPTEKTKNSTVETTQYTSTHSHTDTVSCRLNPQRTVPGRTCKACDVLRYGHCRSGEQRRSVSSSGTTKLAFAAGAVNWRSDRPCYVSQSRRPPRLRRPSVVGSCPQIYTLTAAFGRARTTRSQHKERGRFDTVYSLTNKSVYNPQRSRSLHQIIYR